MISWYMEKVNIIKSKSFSEKLVARLPSANSAAAAYETSYNKIMKRVPGSEFLGRR